MTREGWLISIDDVVSILVAAGCDETVRFVLDKHGVTSPDELNDADLSDVFNELDAIATDLD